MKAVDTDEKGSDYDEKYNQKMEFTQLNYTDSDRPGHRPDPWPGHTRELVDQPTWYNVCRHIVYVIYGLFNTGKGVDLFAIVKTKTFAIAFNGVSFEVLTAIETHML